MNSFYQLPKIIQWLIAILLALVAVVSIGAWSDLLHHSFLCFPLLLLVIPIGQFAITPIMKLTGVYKYLTPMVLVYGASDEKYDLHNGTGFDYLMMMRKTKPGLSWRKKILSYYMEALLKIVAKIEANELPPTVEVRGSSYFFSDRTAEKLGFELKKTGSFEIFNLMCNFLDLTWTYSLAQGKFSWPNLKNIKTATTTGATLVKNKALIEAILKRVS